MRYFVVEHGGRGYQTSYSILATEQELDASDLAKKLLQEEQEAQKKKSNSSINDWDISGSANAATLRYTELAASGGNVKEYLVVVRKVDLKTI